MSLENNGARLLVVNVSHSYDDSPNGHLVVSEISLSAEPGETVALCGPSGSGKSTILRIVAGLIRPTAGEIFLNSHPVRDVPDFLGFVAQDYSRSLLPWLTVHGNVQLALTRERVSRADKKRRVADALERVGLPGVEKLYPWQLSGGMQQRVAIARALVAKPRLLLMDEPFASIDWQVRLELQDLTRQILRDQRMTALVVTHDIDEALYLADKVVVIGGSPSSAVQVFSVPLGEVRDQIRTRESPEYLELRRQVFTALRISAERDHAHGGG